MNCLSQTTPRLGVSENKVPQTTDGWSSFLLKKTHVGGVISLFWDTPILSHSAIMSRWWTNPIKINSYHLKLVRSPHSIIIYIYNIIYIYIINKILYIHIVLFGYILITYPILAGFPLISHWGHTHLRLLTPGRVLDSAPEGWSGEARKRSVSWRVDIKTSDKTHMTHESREHCHIWLNMKAVTHARLLSYNANSKPSLVP
jgi:hypothetical protein